MDRIEAIKALNRIPVNYIGMTIDEANRVDEAIAMATRTLRPVSREQVEKVWRGEWEVDEFGHKCSKCGEYLPSGDDDIFPQFCPNCGDAKTDEAVEMVMERLEALNDKDV